MTCPIDCSKARFALAAVREAAQLVRRVQKEMVGKGLAKGDKSPVTVADFAAQALIGKRLEETFPEDGICRRGVLRFAPHDRGPRDS